MHERFTTPWDDCVRVVSLNCDFICADCGSAPLHLPGISSQKPEGNATVRLQTPVLKATQTNFDLCLQYHEDLPNFMNKIYILVQNYSVEIEVSQEARMSGTI